MYALQKMIKKIIINNDIKNTCEKWLIKSQ